MMKISKQKKFKVAIIGCGAVGMACAYALINQKLASDYLLIDINKSVVQGNVDDLADCQVLLDDSFNSVTVGSYDDLVDADLLIISAGHPPSKSKSRLEEIGTNSKIMKEIALKVKASNFQGLSIIVSNPVDIMATLFQKVTGFPLPKVIGSGTQLDSARLDTKLATMLAVPVQDVKSYVIGEHGDSAVPIWSWTTIHKKPILKYLAHEKRDPSILKTWHKAQMKSVFDIVKNKGNTCYGIGASVAKLVHSIVNNAKEPVIVSAYHIAETTDNIKIPGLYIGQLVHLNRNGWELAKKQEISQEERQNLNKSIRILGNLIKESF